ncbi:MAG: MnhB domain-containing protein [Planctomycetota bacterium]
MKRRLPAPAAILIGAMSIALGAVLCFALIACFERPAPSAEIFMPGAIPELAEVSGVANPVTAVLLNFRAYDTLLELAVLILALLGAQTVAGTIAARRIVRPGSPNLLLAAAVSVVVPVSIVVAGELLWLGADFPGGAFQAGAVLGGAGIMLVVAGHSVAWHKHAAWTRLAVIAGVATFTIVGLSVMLVGGKFLEYPAGWSKSLILLIEAAAMLSVAAVFLYLFAIVATPVALETDGPSSERCNAGQ